MPVTVADLMKKIKFNAIYITKTALKKEIVTADILRPGLEMSGYFDYFQPERIQLFGMKEWSYAMNVVGDERYDLFKAIMTEVTPVIIVARGLEVPDEMVAAAKRQDVAILQSREGTSRLSSIITTYLDEQLAERFTIHGVLMDIYGVGVLIQGASGIGKSETALDLVGRGHRLVADDRVDVYQRDAFTLAGEPAEVLQNMLELRGVGIIDVMNLYGARAVKASAVVNLAIYLEPFDTEKEFDRLGNGIHHTTFAEVEVPQITIPVKTGRNVASIIEAAVMNFRAKEMGYDATQTFEDRLTALIEQNESENN